MLCFCDQNTRENELTKDQTPTRAVRNMKEKWSFSTQILLFLSVVVLLNVLPRAFAQSSSAHHLYVHLSRSQSGAVLCTLSLSPTPESATSADVRANLLWENIRDGVEDIYLHIQTPTTSSDGVIFEWNRTLVALDTTHTTATATVTPSTTATATATTPATSLPSVSETSGNASLSIEPTTTATSPSSGSEGTYQTVVKSPLLPLSFFISQEGQSVGLTVDRAFPNDGAPFEVLCLKDVPSSSNSNNNNFSSVASSLTANASCSASVLRIRVGQTPNFRLWRLQTATYFRVPMTWLANYPSSLVLASRSSVVSSSSTGGSSSSSSLSPSVTSDTIQVPISFTTNLPSTFKQNTMFALCCAIGIGSVVTGGGGWIGLTSLQTLLVSVGGSNHCSEPFTDFYFEGVYQVLVAPTTLASKGIESNQALTVGVILLCVFAHVLVAGVKKKWSRVSFWSAARWSYFPMPFLIAVTYLWIRFNAETFLGVAGSSQTPLIRVSFALSWAAVVLVTAYVWYDALATGHDGYYVLTQVPRALKRGGGGKSGDAERGSDDEEDEAIAAENPYISERQLLRRRRGNSFLSEKEKDVADFSEVNERANERLALERASRSTDGAGPPPLASSPTSPTGKSLVRVETALVRLSSAVLGRFAWLVIPEGSWPLTRGYGVCRGLFRDKTCSFAIFTLIFLCIIAGVSNSASCETLYLNSAIVQLIYLLLFALFRPFRIPILNILWSVIKLLEVAVNICLYYFLLNNYDGGVTDAIPAMSTIIVALNAAFVFYALLVTFSERSARNSEKLINLLRKGLTAKSLASAADMSALDRPADDDPDFQLYVKEYRKMASPYRNKAILKQL